MYSIVFLLSQYELLNHLAQHLSALDLFHLATACSQLYTLILKSEPIFNSLKKIALCDGRGLKTRQEYRGVYKIQGRDWIWGKAKRAHYDEEIEVRVWNLKCDSANALPCLKCGINVCEECRYVSRVRDRPHYLSRRRPHHDPSPSPTNIICYCTPCDQKVESDLSLSLSEYCDCDQYTRWICLSCQSKEHQLFLKYLAARTKGDYEWSDDKDEGMWLEDYLSSRAYWCPCGERAPKDGNVRCAWCKKRHNINTWREEDPGRIPFFDDDPCYPKIVENQMGDQIMYPPLGYNGPIV